MRFLLLLFLFILNESKSQNSEMISWDLNFTIENISADSNEVKIYSLSFFPISSSINTYYLKDNNYAHISWFDSSNHIRTVLIKDENHSHVFTTLGGITYYNKVNFSDLDFGKNNNPLINKSFPPLKFIENKQVGPFNCIVNEVLIPEGNFKLKTTSTKDIQTSNSLMKQIPIFGFENIGFLLDFEMDLGFLKINTNCTNFNTGAIDTSIFSISTEGINEIDWLGEMKLMKLMLGSDFPDEIEEEEILLDDGDH